MSHIDLHSGDRFGIEIAEVPEDRSVYCNASYDIKELVEVDVGIHIWIENLIEDPNPHKGEDCDVWDSWISLENYSRLLEAIEDVSFDEYDDVNRTDFAYTICTSQSSLCFVCGEDLVYREDDVMSITQARGPICCHVDCVSEFYDIIRSIEDEAPAVVSKVV